MILIITRRVVIVYMQGCMSMFVCLYIEFVCIQLTCVLMFVCSLHHACVSMFVRTTHFLCIRRIVCSVQQSGASGKIGWKGCVWASQSHLLCICICKMCVRALLCTCCDFVLVLYLRFTITDVDMFCICTCIVLYCICIVRVLRNPICATPVHCQCPPFTTQLMTNAEKLSSPWLTLQIPSSTACHACLWTFSFLELTSSVIYGN